MAETSFTVERNGTDVIAESERHGTPRDMFWPWVAGNIQVLSIAVGGYVLGFGLSLWQALGIAVVSAVGSFLLVGLLSLAGQRGSAPTMVLSRVAFGKWGNILPGFVSYLLLLGWETVMICVGVLATGTVAEKFGIAMGGATRIIFFVVAVAIVMVLGILGFDAVMTSQKWFTIVTLILTLGYVGLTIQRVHWDVLLARPAGPAAAVIGAGIMVFANFGTGWTSASADYSRYLPAHSSRKGIVGWTTFGGSLPVLILLFHGTLLAGSDPQLAKALAGDPIGTLATLLPTWFIIPFWFVAMAGFVAGSVLDIYSSGLALVTIGVPVKRWQAAAIDGILMVVFVALIITSQEQFLRIFEGFLIGLGVPLGAWTGIFAADLIFRFRTGYDHIDLEDSSPNGVGAVKWTAVITMVLGSALGFGLVTSSIAPLAWFGYLLGPLGLGGREGDWAYANVGVVVAVMVTFLAYLPLARAANRRGK